MLTKMNRFFFFLVLLLLVGACIDDFSTVGSDDTYRSHDKIVIVPTLMDDMDSVVFSLDGRWVATVKVMPFALEMSADSLDVGTHEVEIKKYASKIIYDDAGKVVGEEKRMHGEVKSFKII